MRGYDRAYFRLWKGKLLIDRYMASHGLDYWLILDLCPDIVNMHIDKILRVKMTGAFIYIYINREA